MKIVCATDDNFVQHCTIMLTSLLLNNRNVSIYLLTEGLKYEKECIIRKQVEDLGGTLRICLVNTNIVEKFPMPSDSKIGRAHV